MPLLMRTVRNTTDPLREKVSEGASPSSFFLRASMTLEAALVLPVFIFFMANVLYIFEMIRLQSNMLSALHETGTRMAEYAYFYRYGLSDLAVLGNDGIPGGGGDMSVTPGDAASIAISLIMSEGYVRSEVSKFLGDGYLSHSCLEGGSGGISYLRSSILAGDDMIRLVADYRVKPFIPMGNLEGFSLQSRFVAHAWVGFDEGGDGGSSGSEDEPIVFITPTGTVYHKTRQCTYLKPSIEVIPAELLGSARNNGGGKYYPCEQCRPSRSGLVVITTEGNRYHSSSSCSSIKRTVLEVPLSSVKDHMKACSKCGGG